MTAKDGASDSALQAWAATRMAGSDADEVEGVHDVGRAPGHAQYDPADVITVFMSAHESARQRHEQARATEPTTD